ncbi:MAG: hypothetical protein LCH76_11225 [Actinobacteria bacterium]|nr:hypothetical protein [Actinomycetota bacterium]
MRWLAHLFAALNVGCVVLYLTVHRPTAGAGWADWQFVFMLMVTSGVGWLLASKLPRNPLGWILLGCAGAFVIGVPMSVAAGALIGTVPQVAAWLLWYGGDREDSWAWLPPLTLLFIHLPLRFPDGRLPSARWRWFHWTVIALTGLATAVFSTISVEVYPGLPNPVHWPWLAANPWVVLVFGLPLVVAGMAAMGSLVQRYRGAGGLQRTQIRWVAWAGCLVLTLYVVTLAAPESLEMQAWTSAAYGLIPASIGIAVLRFRLYEIDRVISRTVSYALVTGVVIGVYALTVTAISQLLPGQSSLAVAAATLAAAMLFLPVLRRIQRVVDRRFDREHFDAERTVDAFGEQLRTGLDPTQASQELVAAVQRTLQPSRIGMWVRE